MNPWRRVVAIVGPKAVQLACGHVRTFEPIAPLEQVWAALLASTMPCAKCGVDRGPGAA